MRQTCLNLVYELAKQDPRVVFVGSDISRGTLKGFREEMPKRFFMEGVNEANIIGMAAGLALNGFVPYINTIATFLTRRCFEQIVLDLCLHKLKVRLIGSGGGMVYAPLGPTHLAIEDLSILRLLPNMTIVAPADAEEMKRLMPLTLDWPGPMYIRLAKGGDPVVTSATEPFRIGKLFRMREGGNGLIVSTGVMLERALGAAGDLEAKGFSVGVLHAPTVKPFDVDGLLEAARGVRAIVTIEEHLETGGLGTTIAEILACSDLPRPPRLRRIGIPNEFPELYGSQERLLQHYGITRERLVETMSGLLGA